MLRYVIKGLGFALLLCSMNVAIEAKSRVLLPKGMHFSFDISNPLYYGWYEKTGMQYAVDGILDFRRILLEGRYGWGELLRENPVGKLEAISKNEGHYYSLGVMYNFIKNSEENNWASLGFRYCVATFRDLLSGRLQPESVVFWKSQVSGDGGLVNTQVLECHRFRATWLEIVTGVRVRVWEWIYAGCVVSYRFANNITVFDVHRPFDLIGWGLNEEENTWGLHYYISIRIPFQVDTRLMVK